MKKHISISAGNQWGEEDSFYSYKVLITIVSCVQLFLVSETVKMLCW